MTSKDRDLSPELKQELSNLAETSNQKLDDSGKESANQAFNLGCMIGIIPAAIVVLIGIIATRASWAIVALIVILMLMALLGFANLVAVISRSKTMDRVYRTETNPSIEKFLQDKSIQREQFDLLAWETLPEGAVLFKYLSPPVEPEENFTPNEGKARGDQ
jgi:hypothetical protein